MSHPAEPTFASPPLVAARERVDTVLLRFLADRRAELAAMAPASEVLVEELVRIVQAGGKRFRPALCSAAFRAAGGIDGEPIWNACAALELLHMAALVHDDLMDRGDERRGVPSTHRRFSSGSAGRADHESFGAAVAILVGDLALVLSEQALRVSGFQGEVLARAMRRFDRMRIEMAAGQFLDVAGSGGRQRAAALKSGSYTAVGPVLIGAALAAAEPSVEGPLRVYGGLVGEAFQLRDDVLDGDVPAGAATDVGALVDRAVRSLDGVPLRPEGAALLAELAELLRLPGDP